MYLFFYFSLPIQKDFSTRLTCFCLCVFSFLFWISKRTHWQDQWKESITSKLTIDSLNHLSLPMLEFPRMQILCPLSMKTEDGNKHKDLGYEETVLGTGRVHVMTYCHSACSTVHCGQSGVFCAERPVWKEQRAWRGEKQVYRKDSVSWD